jgi:hypothetical protein
MVAAGVKKIALSHPCDTKELRDSFLEDFDKLCTKYTVKYYVENEPFLTVLFPESMNKGKFNVIFYCEDRYLEEYLALKKQKKDFIDSGNYTDSNNNPHVKRAVFRLPCKGLYRTATLKGLV